MKTTLTVSILLLAVLFPTVPAAQQTGLFGIAADTPSRWQSETGFTQEPLKDTLWWKKFNDPLLDSLISLGLERNYNLAMAARRIEIARQTLHSAQSTYYPSVNLSAGWNKIRNSSVTSSRGVPETTMDYFSGSVSASWEIDLFGKIRATVKQSKEALKATRAETAGVMVSLCSEIATAYIRLRMYQNELTVAKEQLSSQNRVFDAAKSRHEAGLASKLDVAQAAVIAHSTEAMIPGLEANVESSLNSLAMLTGGFPGSLTALTDTAAYHHLDFQQIVSVGVPLDLLRRRPDLAQAEFTIASSAAALGMAKKDYLPSLTIEGSIGFASHSLKDFGKKESLQWSVAPTLNWNIFDGFARRAAVITARENMQNSVDSYNLTLLSAVQEVNDAMASYTSSLRAIDSYTRVVDDAREAFTLAFDLYRDGLSDFTNVADAQISLLQYADRLVTARADAALALVTLYRALGGGWDIDSIYDNK